MTREYVPSTGRAILSILPCLTTQVSRKNRPGTYGALSLAWSMHPKPLAKQKLSFGLLPARPKLSFGEFPARPRNWLLSVSTSLDVTRQSEEECGYSAVENLHVGCPSDTDGAIQRQELVSLAIRSNNESSKINQKWTKLLKDLPRPCKHHCVVSEFLT